MQKFDPLKKYSFRKARDWKYPLWCSLAVNAYLDWLRRSFHSEGTIRSYKYVVYNFCDFLLLKKLSSFEDLNRNLINEFLRIDLHRKIITILSDEQISCINEYRKTCTSILKNNAGVERVIDALGNRDSTTVNVYLTYDELHMRKCALSLKEMSIPMGGATK